MLALAGTGYGLLGILVIILLFVLILYFVRRASETLPREMQDAAARAPQ
jgi:hypothetical protein